MATANSRLKIDYGFDSYGTSNVNGDFRVSGNVFIQGSITSSINAAGDFIPGTLGLQLGNTQNRWNLFANSGNFSNVLTVTGATSLQDTLTVTKTIGGGNTTITGWANVSVSVNSALLTVGTSFIANTSGVYHTGIVNAVSFTTTGFVASAAAIVPTSNSILLGNSTGRFVLSANSGNFSEQLTVSGITTLTGNATLSGTLQTIAGNVNFDTGTLFVDAANNRVGIANTTPGVALEVTGAANVSGNINAASYTVGTSFIANSTGTVVPLQVVVSGGNATGEGGQIVLGYGNNLAASITGQANNTFNFDIIGGNTGSTPILRAFFQNADGTTNNAFSVANTGKMHIGAITENTDSTLKVTGSANISLSVNSASFTVGTAFTANTSGIYHSNLDIRTGSSGLIANTTGAYHTGVVNAATLSVGTINATSNGIIANTTAILFGNSSVNVSINTSSVNVATYLSGAIGTSSNGMLANSTTFTVGNSSVNVSITTAGITSSGGTGVNPSSNTVGTALGTTTQRWVLNANTGSFAGAVSGITTLGAGNTTITGFVNATSTIQGGSSLTIAGSASGITTLAAGNTTITGFVNATSTLAAGNTTITGFVGANSFAVSTNFIANSSQLTIATPVSANGSTGTSGFVLLSNGETGSPYWATPPNPGASVTNDTTTNSTRYLLIANQTSGSITNTYVSSSKLTFNPNTGVLGVVGLSVSGSPLTANGGTGTSGQVLASGGSSGAPYWITAPGASVTDDTINGTRYLLFANQTSGSLTSSYVSSSKLTFNPSTGTLTSTEVTASSDSRLKTNIKTIEEPLDILAKLRGVSFDRTNTGTKSYGVIAQEIEQILPEVVYHDEEGFKSVSYNSIIGFLIEAVKSQQTQIDYLTNSGSKDGN